jgi:hypothetical protein
MCDLNSYNTRPLGFFSPERAPDGCLPPFTRCDYIIPRPPLTRCDYIPRPPRWIYYPPIAPCLMGPRMSDSWYWQDDYWSERQQDWCESPVYQHCSDDHHCCDSRCDKKKHNDSKDSFVSIDELTTNRRIDDESATNSSFFTPRHKRAKGGVKKRFRGHIQGSLPGSQRVY